ncbi:MAG TPA: hypothetical protein VHP38_11210 [Ruminiclostridium sp.]|nr:hypothetical protein [Ruminiclostridium sp.]
MPHSKPRYTSRKYLPPPKSHINIPYPNEIEDIPPQKGIQRDVFNLSYLIEFIRSRITIEEIIIIGVIVILLGEEVKDEFLILMLLYILIF